MKPRQDAMGNGTGRPGKEKGEMTTDIGGFIENHRTAKGAVEAILASADDKSSVRAGEIVSGVGWNSLSFHERGLFGWRGCGTILASLTTLRKIKRSFR